MEGHGDSLGPSRDPPRNRKTNQLMHSLRSILCFLAGVLLAAPAFGQAPALPIGLDALNDWAAGKVGGSPTDCSDEPELENTFGQFNPPLFPWSDGSIEVDLEFIHKYYKLKTNQAFGILVQEVLLHEYMHAFGYGSQGESGWVPSSPLTTEDCEHFHMQTFFLAFICDSALHWTPPTMPWQQEVLDELCRVYDQYKSDVEGAKASFAGCGVISEKVFPGGVTIPEFDPSADVPDCLSC